MTIIVVISRKAFCDFVTTSAGHSDRFAVVFFFSSTFHNCFRIVHYLFSANFSMRSIRSNNRPREMNEKKMKTEKKKLWKNTQSIFSGQCFATPSSSLLFLLLNRFCDKWMDTADWILRAFETFWDDRFHSSTTTMTTMTISVAQKIATLPRSLPRPMFVCVAEYRNWCAWKCSRP